MLFVSSCYVLILSIIHLLELHLSLYMPTLSKVGDFSDVLGAQVFKNI